MHFIHQINNINTMGGPGMKIPTWSIKLFLYFLEIITFCPNSKIFDFEKHTKIIPGITV